MISIVDARSAKIRESPDFEGFIRATRPRAGLIVFSLLFTMGAARIAPAGILAERNQP
jgi:hypothetical protein